MAVQPKTGSRKLNKIVRQRAKVLEAQAQVRAETKVLAELLRDARDDPDPRVSSAGAAREIGVTKSYASGLIQRLEAGELG